MLHLMLLYMCSDFTRRSIFLGGASSFNKVHGIVACLVHVENWKTSVVWEFCFFWFWDHNTILRYWNMIETMKLSAWSHSTTSTINSVFFTCQQAASVSIQQFASVNTTLVFQSFFPHESGRLQLYVLCWTMWTKNAMLLPNLDANKAAIKTSFFEVRITT